MQDQLLTLHADWLGFDPTRHDLTDEQRREADALLNRPKTD